MAQTAGSAPPARRWLGLCAVGLGTLVNPLDTSVNIAFPFITDAFAIPVAAIQWIVICYVLTYACLMLAFGRLGDLVGHRRIFAAGLAVSAVSFVMCAMAGQFGWFLFARGLQGLGTALVISCAPALITALYPENMRGRALGNFTMIYGIGAVAGPLLGGMMIELWDWTWVFWFRLPLSVVALFLIGALPARPADGERETFDIAGAVLLATGLAGLLMAANRLQHLDDGIWPAAGLAVLSVAALAGFVRQERRSAAPIIRLDIFRDPDFSLLSLANLLVFLVGFAVLLLMPYYLIGSAGQGATLGGLVLAGSAVGMVAAGLLGGRLTDRVPASRIGFAGALAVIAATLAISTWPADAGLARMLPPLLLHGFGLGLFQVAFTHIATGRLPVKDRGVAGSLALLTRTIGMVIGATAITMTFAGLEATAQAAGLTPGAAFLEGFSRTFLYLGAVLGVFVALTLLRPRIWFGGPGSR
jgi:MFS family permease